MTNMNEIEYVQLSVADLDEVEDLLVKEFYVRENLSRGVGEDGSTPKNGMHTKMVRQCLGTGLTIGARDKVTGKLIGVRTSYATSREDKGKEPQEEPKYNSEAEKKLYVVLEKAKNLYDVFQDPNVNKVIEFDRLSVHRDYCRRGIAKKMVQMSMELGAKSGCQMARTETTSPYSERLFVSLGFEIKAVLDPHNEDKELVNADNMEYKAVKILVKRL